MARADVRHGCARYRRGDAFFHRADDKRSALQRRARWPDHRRPANLRHLAQIARRDLGENDVACFQAAGRLKVGLRL